MQFARRRDIPKVSRYGDFRPFLREDFLRHCAYCTAHEDEIGGEDHFEIDHYRPKSKFPKLINKYANLYYSCHGCNKKGAKGENWPSRKLISKGFKFFDSANEDPYGTHIREGKGGKLTHVTRCGQYSIDILRLNRRGLLVLRQQRKRMRVVLRKELGRLLDILEKANKQKHEPTAEVLHRLQLLRSALRERPILTLLPEWWND